MPQGQLPSNFLTKLLKAQEAGELSEEGVQQCALEMLLAGTDTSSVTMSYLLIALRDDPLLEARLKLEVERALEGAS